MRLLPFEVRYLARTTNGPNPSRPGPDRWVIDVPRAQAYSSRRIAISKFPNIEDRLFVNDEHMPLLFSSVGKRT